MIKEKVRYLRKNQTKTEEIVWDRIRNKKLSGYKFARQYPIKFRFDNKIRYFIADFYCAEAKLIIEIDGKIHEKQKEYDLLREVILKYEKYNIIRFQNKEIEENIEKVLDNLKGRIGAS